MRGNSIPIVPAAAAVVLAAVAGASARAAPASVVPLVREGDVIAGVGTVTGINSVAVNNTGHWLVEADTDAAITSDVVVIKDGVVSMQAGGGVVADSTPEGEHAESLHKMRGPLRAIELAEELEASEAAMEAIR